MWWERLKGWQPVAFFVNWQVWILLATTTLWPAAMLNQSLPSHLHFSVEKNKQISCYKLLNSQNRQAIYHQNHIQINEKTWFWTNVIFFYGVISVIRDWLSMPYIDGLLQERCNSSALTMELDPPCTNPSMWQYLVSTDVSTYSSQMV